MTTAAETKETVASSAEERAARFRSLGRSGLWLSVALAAALVAELNYLSFRHFERWDWTEEHIYTLSERTLAELSALHRDVELYLFLSEAEPNFPEVKELLERYRAGSAHFSVQYVDPDRDPNRYQVLAQRFGLGTGQLESGELVSDVAAVVASGDEKWTITRDDLVSLDFESFDEDAAPQVNVKSEQAITGAIVQVTSGRATKVCVSSGHGEWTPTGADRSLHAFSDELRRDNVEMETVDLLGGRAVPHDCDALFVISPLRAFGPEEVEKIEAFLALGKGALFALDPVIHRDQVDTTGLERMLGSYGVTIDASVVLELDASRLLPPGNPAGPFLVAGYREHPTTEALMRMGGAALFSMARSVRALEGSEAVPLLQTSDRGFGETDLASLDPANVPAPGPTDIAGPVTVAVAAERALAPAPRDEGDGEDDGDGDEEDEDDDARHTRIAVVGDADFLQSAAIGDARFTNLDVALALTGWLTERETLISVPAKQIDAVPMVITEDDLLVLLFKLLVLIPGAMLLLGFAMWWSRRA